VKSQTSFDLFISSMHLRQKYSLTDIGIEGASGSTTFIQPKWDCVIMSDSSWKWLANKVITAITIIHVTITARTRMTTGSSNLTSVTTASTWRCTPNTPPSHCWCWVFETGIVEQLSGWCAIVDNRYAIQINSFMRWTTMNGKWEDRCLMSCRIIVRIWCPRNTSAHSQQISRTCTWARCSCDIDDR
jgi:hypothetical protein